LAGLKEIRRRIASVNNTRQITRAMKLVSAAKLRRAQDAAENGRAYSDNLAAVFSRTLADLQGELKHPLVKQHDEVRSRLVILVAGDRGLCGPYNTNILKAVTAGELNSSLNLAFIPIGKRMAATSRRLGWKEAAVYESLADDPALWPIEEMASRVINDFLTGSCQEVVLYYTKFHSALTQTVTCEVLLPFGQFSAAEAEANDPTPAEASRLPVKYGAPPEEILEKMIPLLITRRLSQAILEARASEHGARMTAMDAATNNADELIEKLRLFYNRARQSSITTELIDIVGGAEALN